VRSHSDRIAEALRQERALLDDVTRARIERRLVEAWEARLASRRAVSESKPPAAAVPRIWAASVAAFVFVALLVVLFEVAGTRRASSPDSVQMAHFELRISDAAVQTGVVGEGQTLETGKFGSIDVNAGGSRVLLYPDSRMRFDRISADDVRLSLIVGKVEVTFHPIRPGEQSISVETRVASVRAVGTRFSVSVDLRGDTSVDVSEGVVSVTSGKSRAERTLAAGERVRIGADGREKPVLVLIQADRALAALDPGLPPPAAEPVASAADAPRQAAIPQGRAEQPRQARRQVEREQGEPAEAREPETAPQTPETAVAEPQADGSPLDPAAEAEDTDPLQAARLMIQMGQYTAARNELRQIASRSRDNSTRAMAFTLIAESYLAQGYYPRAADFYNDAARVSRYDPVSRKAVFYLARLLENHVKDNQAAVSAYRRYLRESPEGEHRLQALEALCRLGDGASCAEALR
jgi:TolA-binding protein